MTGYKDGEDIKCPTCGSKHPIGTCPMAKPMTEEKLPRELPLLTFDYATYPSVSRKAAKEQRDTNQLLYDAALAENERREAELAKVRQDTAEEIFKEIDKHRLVNALHGIPIISEEWLQSLKSKYGGA